MPTMPTREPVIELMDPMQAEILRKMTPEQRLAIAFRMWDFAHDMIYANLQREHPDWSPKELELATGKRLNSGGNS